MAETASLTAILRDRGSQPQQLIEVLQDVQDQEGWISESAMRSVSAELGVSLIEVYRVANFYKAFRLAPRGRHTLTVCEGTACHVRGAGQLLEQLEGQLDVAPGETTPDGMFTLESVNCLGACALGPVVVVDGEYHHHMTPAKLRRVIRKLRSHESVKESSGAED